MKAIKLAISSGAPYRLIPACFRNASFAISALTLCAGAQ